jgi:IS5 family transposase
MQTSKSPRTVMCVAYHLARKLLPEHSCKFSRHDFTLAQLFACLVVREFFGLSYRRTETLLADSPQWLANIGLSKSPDHNTLWRAFELLISTRRCNRILDLLSQLFTQARLLQLRTRPLAMDSTCFEQRHRSRHYDRRCRRMAQEKAAPSDKKPGKWGKIVNDARSRRLRVMPKLAVAVDSGCHLILSAKTHLGNGSDAPDFEELLFHAWRRAKVKTVVADAGYDSEANHCIARQGMNVRSIIPPGIGRPTKKLPTGRWRRHMAKRFARKADKKLYGQRAQSETVHSMIKRNQGESLRSRTPARRKKEMMFKALVHNIMLACADDIEG